MWRLWTCVAKGFRYNVPCVRNGTLLAEDEHDLSLTLWNRNKPSNKCLNVKPSGTEDNTDRKGASSFEWRNSVEYSSFLEIIGLSTALALGWQVSHFHAKPEPEKCSLRNLAVVAFARPGFPKTRLDVNGRKALLKINENEDKKSTTIVESNPSNDLEVQEIMNHIVLNIEQGHNLRMADLLNETGVQLLSAHQRRETSLFGLWISQESSYVDEAFSCLQQSRELGSEKGAFNLGLCYEQGFGTRIDLEKAVVCYEEAAGKGHAAAQYNLGLLHYQKKLENSDRAKGISFIRMAAQQGLDRAWSTLSIALQNSTTNSSRAAIPCADDTDKGLQVSSSQFRKSQSAPFMIRSSSSDDFDKQLVIGENGPVSFYSGN